MKSYNSICRTKKSRRIIDLEGFPRELRYCESLTNGSNCDSVCKAKKRIRCCWICEIKDSCKEMCIVVKNYEIQNWDYPIFCLKGRKQVYDLEGMFK